MSRYEAFVAVGSNIDAEENIPTALERLRERVLVLATSTFYHSAPVGRPMQPPFLNGVWHLRTSLAARPSSREGGPGSLDRRF